MCLGPNSWENWSEPMGVRVRKFGNMGPGAWDARSGFLGRGPRIWEGRINSVSRPEARWKHGNGMSQEQEDECQCGKGAKTLIPVMRTWRAGTRGEAGKAESAEPRSPR